MNSLYYKHYSAMNGYSDMVYIKRVVGILRLIKHLHITLQTLANQWHHIKTTRHHTTVRSIL